MEQQKTQLTKKQTLIIGIVTSVIVILAISLAILFYFLVNVGFNYNHLRYRLIMIDGKLGYSIFGQSDDYYYSTECEETSIIIPNKVKGLPVISIERRSFNSALGDLKTIKKFELPDSVISIEKGALSDICSGQLENITVASENKKYHCDGNCLIETESKTLILGCKNSIIPTDGSVTNIGKAAFDGCTSLLRITIPNSITDIDSTAFMGCSRLIEIYNKSSLPIVKGRFDYGYIAYHAKDVYTSEYLSKLNTTTDGYVIYTDEIANVKSLIAYTGNETQLTLPYGITEINYSAFEDCSSITSITIPNSVKRIQQGAFFNCNGTITFRGTKSQWNSIYKSNWHNGSCTIHCSDGIIIE